MKTLRDHLARFTVTGGDALVFTNTIGGRIDLSNFHRNVWKHAVAATFPTGPLRQVRRQDLRHAAITLWLNSGVPLKVAQTWSGHKPCRCCSTPTSASCNTTNTSPTNASKTPSTHDPTRGKHGTPMAHQTETKGQQWQKAATTATTVVRASCLVSPAIRAKCLVRGWSRDGESNPDLLIREDRNGPWVRA